jgi:hypothetical protein
MSETAERDAIDQAFPDRSAGRWCASCEQYGSHHTATHAHYLDAALRVALRSTP